MSEYKKGFDDGYKSAEAKFKYESKLDISDGSMFQIANLKDRLAIAVQALEFYANPHNHITPSGKIGVTAIWTSDCEKMEGFVYIVSGKRARQSLLKMKGEK